MGTVYILTNFSQFLKSYSPILVTELQIKMLRMNGIEPVLLVSEGWEPPENSTFADVRTEALPAVPVSNEPGLDATFERDVETLYEAMKKILSDDAVVLTHDLIFLPDYVKHNVAARKLAEEKPDIRWIHMVHSATSPQGLIQERMRYGEKYVELLGEKFPNSIIIFPNGFSIPRVARNFSYGEDEVFEVPHPSDLTEGMEAIVKRIYYEKKLYEPQVLMVYPCRLDRGKNVEMNIELISALNKRYVSAKLVVCDFQSTGGDKVTYRNELKDLAAEKGISDKVIFMSEFDESAQMEIDHKAVLDLFTLSNVFMMPSKSETYSLVAQEAMSRGNLCILNRDFAPFMQIYGDNAIYRQFSANIGLDGMDGEITTTYRDIDGYFGELAGVVQYWLMHDKTARAKTWVRTQRNMDAVFKNYLEPLLHRRDESAEI